MEVYSGVGQYWGYWCPGAIAINIQNTDSMPILQNFHMKINLELNTLSEFNFKKEQSPFYEKTNFMWKVMLSWIHLDLKFNLKKNKEV